MKFDIEKHKIFVATTKHHPYDGKGPWKLHGKYCPNCLSQNGHYHLLGNRREMQWNECDDCGWNGGMEDTLNYYEYLNMKRTKLIERMLK